MGSNVQKGVAKRGLREPKKLYFLNDYWPEKVNRLRIEEKRSGERCLWKEKTTIGGMMECKRYLEQEWGIAA
jgi:hypothetical protein